MVHTDLDGPLRMAIAVLPSRANVRVSNYNNFVRRSYSSPDRFQISSTGGEIIVYDTQFRKNAGYKDYTTAQNAGRQQAAGPAATRVNTSGVRGSSQIQTRSSAPTVSAASVNAPRRDTAPRTTSNYPVNATAARTEIPPASKTKSKGNVITPRPAAKAGRPTQNPSAGVSNAGPVSQKSSAGPASQGSSEVSKGSGSQGNIKPTDKKAAKSDSGKAADKKASNQDGSQDDSKPSGKAVINTDNSQDDNKSADKTVTKPDNSKGDKEKRR